MRLLKRLLFFACLVPGVSINAQTKKPNKATYLKQYEQDSLNYSMMQQKSQYLEENWKKGLKRRQKRTKINSSIGGAVLGAFAGVLVTFPVQAGCELITLPTTIISGRRTCDPIIGKGALIGAITGGLIGLGIGAQKANEMKKRRFEYY